MFFMQTHVSKIQFLCIIHEKNLRKESVFYNFHINTFHKPKLFLNKKAFGGVDGSNRMLKKNSAFINLYNVSLVNNLHFGNYRSPLKALQSLKCVWWTFCFIFHKLRGVLTISCELRCLTKTNLLILHHEIFNFLELETTSS